MWPLCLLWKGPSPKRAEKPANEAEFRIDNDGLLNPRIRNVALLSVNRRKSLPRLPSKRRYWAYFTAISVVLIAGIGVGTTLGVMESRSHHHTMDQPSPSRVSSSENPPNAVPTPSSTSTLGLIPSSTSTLGPIPSLQPIPAALATIFQSSFWIWQGAEALTGVPSGDWAFRKTLPISTALAREAIALLTVDDGFQLYHNGQFIAENSTLGWQMATAVRVNLDPGSNVFAIRAHNSPPGADPSGNSPAGLLASIQILYANGTTTTISSDATWRVTQPVPDGFQSLSFNDTQWQSATAVGVYGSGPWGNIVIPSY